MGTNLFSEIIKLTLRNSVWQVFKHFKKDRQSLEKEIFMRCVKKLIPEMSESQMGS